ncbi:hypothetical protein BGZ94_006176, partial [Podila epigama]
PNQVDGTRFVGKMYSNLVLVHDKLFRLAKAIEHRRGFAFLAALYILDRLKYIIETEDEPQKVNLGWRGYFHTCIASHLWDNEPRLHGVTPSALYICHRKVSEAQTALETDLAENPHQEKVNSHFAAVAAAMGNLQTFFTHLRNSAKNKRRFTELLGRWREKNRQLGETELVPKLEDVLMTGDSIHFSPSALSSSSPEQEPEPEPELPSRPSLNPLSPESTRHETTNNISFSETVDTKQDTMDEDQPLSHRLE